MLGKDFDISRSQKSFDLRLDFHATGNNNLCVVDEQRRNIKVYGSDKDGKGKETYCGQAFIGVTRIK